MTNSQIPSIQVEGRKVNYNPQRFSFGRAQRQEASADSTTPLASNEAPISGYGSHGNEYEEHYNQYAQDSKVYMDPFATRAYNATDVSLADSASSDHEHQGYQTEPGRTLPYDPPPSSHPSSRPVVASEYEPRAM